MTIQVRPIVGEDPGICQVLHRDGRMCSNEAVVIATIPIPGMEADTDVQFCRIDWADWVAAQEIDLGLVGPAPRVHGDIGEAALEPQPGRTHMTAEY